MCAVLTEWALRKGADCSPRETHCGRDPADGAQRELLGEGAGGEGADDTSGSRHCERFRAKNGEKQRNWTDVERCRREEEGTAEDDVGVE